MTIYQHRDTVIAQAGSTSSISLNVLGGLCRHILVKANTSSTVFKVNIVDDKSLQVLTYGFNTGELNDTLLYMPMAGKYTVNVTNASPDDTFSIYLGVEE